MEKNRKPRNKPTHVWSISLQQRQQEYTMREKTVSSIIDAGNTGQPHAKE